MKEIRDRSCGFEWEKCISLSEKAEQTINAVRGVVTRVWKWKRSKWKVTLTHVNRMGMEIQNHCSGIFNVSFSADFWNVNVTRILEVRLRYDGPYLLSNLKIESEFCWSAGGVMKIWWRSGLSATEIITRTRREVWRSTWTSIRVGIVICNLRWPTPHLLSTTGLDALLCLCIF